eukprot:CAMPEP_0117438994 /NCGR_PEP_ID=MMETSP0759-20121206/2341_1 /TAXON_ID=63605 /ORGANISM="Percolomonas cosmopolitus, Strain WS" /LENGTH=1511 /DNA_ID=CAMNT_0005230705 /DNA_START=439 /DNA_END=4974 /DNA_ORIENTATION=+
MYEEKSASLSSLQAEYERQQAQIQQIKQKYDDLVLYLRENDANFFPLQKREAFQEIKQVKMEYDGNVDVLMQMQQELGDLQATLTNMHHDMKEMKNERRAYKDMEMREHGIKAQRANHKKSVLKKRATNKNKSHLTKMEEIEQLQREKEQHMQQVIDNAKSQREYAIQKLAQTQKRVAAEKEKQLQKQLQQEQRKNRAFDQLGTSTKRAMDRVKALNEKKLKSQKVAMDHEQNEMARIAAEGGNPYEVIRERKVRTQYTKNIRKMQQKMQKAQSAIEEKIQKEEEQFMKHNQETRKHHEFIDNWKDSISKRAQDEKVANYIASRTQNGSDVIDPLGKEARIHPSKVIVTKDWSFGLGTSSVKNPHLMDRMTKKYPRIGANATMIPKDDAWAPGFASSAATALGKLKRVKKERKDDGEDSDEELAEPKFKGLWEGKKIISEDYVDEDKLHVRQLTRLEKQYLDKKRKRARANIVQKQICWGKEFKGQAYIPDPKEIVFKDFELGKTYTKRIKLTNASLTFNSFKLLPLNNEIKNFFDIDYTPPGKQSAGTSTTITVTFRPRKLEDIEDYLPILAQTGEFRIPLKCYIKKVVVTIISPQEKPADEVSGSGERTLDFGSVMLAESSEVVVRIKNEGALDTALTLSGPAVMENHLMHDEVNAKLPDRVLLFSAKQVLIRKFSTTFFKIKFFPQKVQPLDSKVELHFEDDWTEDFSFRLVGTGTDVSIFLEDEIMNFQFSYLNTLYRDRLTVCNRGKIAMKVEFPLPAALRNHLEFVPNVAFVQPGDPFSIQVKFRPRETILTDCAKFIQQADGADEQNSIRVPIKLSIPDQAMPVFTYLQTTVTTSKLEIQPPYIDFGFSSVDEAVSIPVSITNHSLLNQEFGFLKLPEEISITPDHGFGNILPGETLNYNVIFTPTAAIEYHMKCVLKTVRNEEFVIPCKAAGTQPPLKISKPLVISKSTAIGDFCSETIQMSNMSNKPQNFNFVLTQEQQQAGISILPTSGTIVPKKEVSVVVKFVPRPEFFYPPPPVAEEEQKEEPKKTDKKAAAKKGGKKGAPEPEPESVEEKVVEPPKPVDNYEHWERSGEHEEWSRHKKWLIPCYIANYASGAISLGFQTNVVKPHLTAEDAEGRVVTLLDFHETPVQRPIRKSFFVCNNSPVACRVDFQPFEYAAFRIVKPPHALKSAERCEMILEFCPLQATNYEYNLQLLSMETNNLSITLQGAGETPNLQITPADEVVDMGDALENDSDRTHQFTLKNNGSIPVPFEVQFPQNLIHPLNFDGSPPFVCNPSSGVVEAGESQTLTISFFPDHACKYYRGECWIVYGADEQTHKTLLIGRAWKSGVFVVFDDKDMEKPNEEKAKEIASEAFEDPFSDLGLSLVTEENFEQVFNHISVGEKREFTFKIGNTKSAAKSKVDFSFEGITAEDAKKGFTLDPQKGSVDSGTTKDIKVTFAPSADVASLMPVQGVDIWLELNCHTTIKNPSNGETKRFNFSFRGQVDSASTRKSVEEGGKKK